MDESGHELIGDQEATEYLKTLPNKAQVDIVKTAGVNMICPTEEDIEPVVKGFTLAQQGSLVRRLGWQDNIEFMVQG